MKKALLQISAISVTAVFLATAADLSWLFLFKDKLHPATVEDFAKKTDANRRVRSAEEEAERREEEDDENAEPLPVKSKANPFLPKRRLPKTPQVGSPAIRLPLVDLPEADLQSADSTPHTDLPPAGSSSAKKLSVTGVGDTDTKHAQSFDKRGIKLSSFSADSASVAAADLTHCKAIVERTLSILPSQLTASLDQLTLHFSKRESRGLSNSHIVELQCGGLSDHEVAAVLVHELGHIADLGAFRGTSASPSAFLDGSEVTPIDDLSVQFYGISWRDSDTKKFNAQRQDFVSGYAGADPFEDFAESFIAYILHGDDFRTLAHESSALQSKYDFLRTEVFSGAEYMDERSMRDGQRVWDVTLVEYDLAGFWAGETDKEVIAAR